MFERIQGKTAFITGASAGIGEATAKLFAKFGSNVIITARREENLINLQKDILEESPSVKVHIVKLDVSDHEAVKEAFKNLPEWASQIDFLVNNAGLSLGMLPLVSIPENSIDTMLNTNVKGLIFVTQQVLPRMMESNSGHIINIGSIVGQNASPF
ncbi:putative oxidoreductase, partial [Smittium culicis]